MAKKESRAVEVLPFITDTVCGAVKGATARVTKNGKNIATPKVVQPNKTGRNPSLFTKGAEKWRCMTKAQKCYWDDIAKQEDFWSRWQAFMSTFLKLADIHGLDYVMAQDLEYYVSENRKSRDQDFANSQKRQRQYEVAPEAYVKTEENLRVYPVAHDSALVYVKLLDLTDINNALRCKFAYRTDPIVEYDYYPIDSGEVETGYYVKVSRNRVGDEVYELFQKT